MNQFRYRQAIKLPYDKQGYIYFTLRRYRQQSDDTRRTIDTVITNTCGEFATPIREYLLTDASARYVSTHYSIALSSLWRYLCRAYVELSKKI